MLTLTGFLFPYLVALATFRFLTGTVAYLRIVLVCSCVLIAISPWFVPEESRMLRFLASISATMLALKVIDIYLDIQHRRPINWKEYVDYIFNPFSLVRRSLGNERRPPYSENITRLVTGIIGCALAIAVLAGLFKLTWSSVPFVVEHASKVTALMLAIASGLSAAAAAWRLSGGAARDFMDRPFFARTPAEFWRRYNRNVQQFFWMNVYRGSRGRRAPIRTMILVFALSALLHEWLFFAAVGRMQGYQTAFFTLQGLAAASTARIKVSGKIALPWVVGTIAFNLLTSVLFFASINSITPFYSRELPRWLQGW
jgi:hypothetical protein